MLLYAFMAMLAWLFRLRKESMYFLLESDDMQSDGESTELHTFDRTCRAHARMCHARAPRLMLPFDGRQMPTACRCRRPTSRFP